MLRRVVRGWAEDGGLVSLTEMKTLEGVSPLVMV